MANSSSDELITAQEELAIGIEEWVSDMELTLNSVEPDIMAMMPEPERKFVERMKEILKEYRESPH